MAYRFTTDRRRKGPARMAAACRGLRGLLLFGLLLLPIFAPLLLLCALALSKGNILGFHALVFCQALALLCFPLEAHLLARLFAAAQSGRLCTQPAARSCALLFPCSIIQCLAFALHAPLWLPLALLSCLFFGSGLAAAAFCCLLREIRKSRTSAPETRNT